MTDIVHVDPGFHLELFSKYNKIEVTLAERQTIYLCVCVCVCVYVCVLVHSRVSVVSGVQTPRE